MPTNRPDTVTAMVHVQQMAQPVEPGHAAHYLAVVLEDACTRLATVERECDTRRRFVLEKRLDALHARVVALEGLEPVEVPRCKCGHPADDHHPCGNCEHDCECKSPEMITAPDGEVDEDLVWVRCYIDEQERRARDGAAYFSSVKMVDRLRSLIERLVGERDKADKMQAFLAHGTSGAHAALDAAGVGHDGLAERVGSLAAERDRLRAEVARLSASNTGLRAEVASLQTDAEERVARLEESGPVAARHPRMEEWLEELDSLAGHAQNKSDTDKVAGRLYAEQAARLRDLAAYLRSAPTVQPETDGERETPGAWHFECPECGYDSGESGDGPVPDGERRPKYCGVCAEDSGRDVRLTWTRTPSVPNPPEIPESSPPEDEVDISSLGRCLVCRCRVEHYDEGACQLNDGRWTCSRECWTRAARMWDDMPPAGSVEAASPPAEPVGYVPGGAFPALAYGNPVTLYPEPGRVSKDVPLYLAPPAPLPRVASEEDRAAVDGIVASTYAAGRDRLRYNGEWHGVSRTTDALLRSLGYVVEEPTDG
jgi:hypothetical protein